MMRVLATKACGREGVHRVKSMTCVCPATVSLTVMLVGFGCAAQTTPPPPPPICDPAGYVFFDTNSEELTEDSRTIVENAAHEFRRLGAEELHILAYADAAHREPEGLSLSLRRAESVKAELIRIGIVEDAVIAEAFVGPEHFLVLEGMATPPHHYGLNRRAVIWIPCE